MKLFKCGSLKKAEQAVEIIKQAGFKNSQLIFWDIDNSECGYHDISDITGEENEGYEKRISVGINLGMSFGAKQGFCDNSNCDAIGTFEL